jgi:tetratricopeptide (TPR) repeat protein
MEAAIPRCRDRYCSDGMSDIARMHTFGAGGSCIGRNRERQSFSELIQQTDSDLGLDVTVLCGLGGIGKTTLAYALIDDLLGAGVGATALSVDCVALPNPPDMSSLLRVLDAESPTPTGLADAASDLDRVATIIRSAEPPSDSDASAWLEMRRRAAELLTFASAAAIETLAFGQPGGSASQAVITGVQAIAASRNAIAEIVPHLRDAGQLSDDEARIALDPESHLLVTLTDFLASVSNGQRLLILFDKAENLSPRLFRITDLFAAAAARAEIRLSLILAGRLTRIPAPDGSDLTVREFLEATARESLAIDLAPFSAEQVRELLLVTSIRLHSSPTPPAPPPSWLNESIARLSGGLPLWAASIAETILKNEPEPWSEENLPRLRELVTADASFETMAGRIFREVQLDTSQSALPLLISLALAPATASTGSICSAAGVPEAAVTELRGRYSFMRGDRLHDAALAVLRQHLISASETQAEVLAVTGRLLEQLDSTPPGESPFDGDPEWTGYVRNRVSLRFWLGSDVGAWTTINYILIGTVASTAWIAPILEDAAWFLERRPCSDRVRRLLRTCARSAYPVILRDILAPGGGDESKAVLRAAQGGKAFTASIGRYLDEIDRALSEFHNEIAPDARIGAESIRLKWLAVNRFDDEASALAIALGQRLSPLPKDAGVRSYIAESTLEVLREHVTWAKEEQGEDRERRNRRVDELVAALANISDGGAASGVRTALQGLGARPMLEKTLDTLLTRTELLSANLRLSDDLGMSLLYLGRYGDAAGVYRRSLGRSPDWISGSLGLSQALICRGDVAAAVATLETQLRISAENADKLSDYGRQQRSELGTYAVISHLLEDDVESASEVTETHTVELGGWGALLLEVYDADSAAGVQRVAAMLEGGTDRKEIAAEAAIAFERSGRHTDAIDALRVWEGDERPRYLRDIEELLLAAAVRQGLVTAALAAGEQHDKD